MDPAADLPERAVTLILAALEEDPEAKTAFTDGLSKRIFRMNQDPGAEAQERLLRFVNQWVLDVLLNGTSWRARVEASEAAVDRGEVAEPIDGASLRALLSR